MSDFTYQSAPTKGKYETYEWDNVWLEHANDTQTPRVLYIGDSISCGIRRIATAQTENKIYFDGFGTSKSLDNPWFKKSATTFAEQQPGRKIVLVNNGLHGWHLSHDGEYERYLEDMVAYLQEHFEGTPVAIVLTTWIADEKNLPAVHQRNAAAIRVAEKLNAPVIDLYSVSEANKDLISDGVHFKVEGYQKLAAAVIARIKEIVPELA